MKFDVVYTWVDGSDPDYIDKCNAYAKNKKDTNPERFRDNFNIIKYSIRSLETYFNEFNNIYILTARPQIPEWCDVNNDRVKIVHHDEVIPEKYLPTFNPNVIESFLHRLPDLSENFLYMNDDFLFGDTVMMDTFYRDGKYSIFNTFFGENLSWRIYDGYLDIIGLGIIEHSPMIVNRRNWENTFKLLPEKVERMRKTRFRKDKNICPYKFYRYYMLKHKPEESDPVTIFELNRKFKFHKLTNNLNKQRRVFENMAESCPNFYCLNDDLSDEPNDEVLQLVQDFLKSKYPSPSSFEI